MSQKAARAARQRELYLERKAAGLCVHCAAPAVFGTVRCEVHTASARLIVARIKQARRRDGRCPDCGQLPISGRVKCEKCLAFDRRRKQRATE